MLSEHGIYKAMCRPGIHESGKSERRIRGAKKNAERIWVRKSGSVETNYLRSCTGRVNAVLNLCGGLRTAQTFFESPVGGSFSFVWAALALVLAADEEALEQLAAVWPGPPQNMHKRLSKRRCRSCWVSLPSFPSLSARGLDDPEDDPEADPEDD